MTMENPGTNGSQTNTSTTERLALDLLRHPSMWGETFLSGRDGSPRRYRSYQVEDLECQTDRIVHLDGRAVGKTVNLCGLLLWFVSVHKGKSVLVAAPYQGHLDAIIEEVEFQLDSSDLLRSGLRKRDAGHGSGKRQAYYQLTFKNGCTAYFRPAGVKGYAFRSLHVDLLLADEAARIPERAWNALRQCLKPGGRMRVYSTPNGLRDTTYYRITDSEEWTVFHWPTWIVPDWDAKRRRDLLDFYGGEDTSGWRHEVAGEHGMPTYGAFNLKQIQNAVTEVDDYKLVKIHGSALDDCKTESAVHERLQSLLGLDGGHGRCWLGGDLGYANDPTELLVFEEDEDEALWLVLRVHAERVPYPAISEMIALIDAVYAPVGLAIDRGGNGTAVEQELLQLDKYALRGFAGRLTGVDFGGSTIVGEDEAGQPIRRRTKEHMTLLINRQLNARKLRLPETDKEIEDQLCTHSYTLSQRGIIYGKGYDHIVDAMRCAMLARSLELDPQYMTEIEIPDLIFVPTGPNFNKIYG
jgi:hypothetical protein